MFTQQIKTGIILLLQFPLLLLAQTGVIKGTVSELANNLPIPFANVVIEGTTTGATTDIDGKYIIENLQPGFYTVSTSYLGFKTQSQAEIQVTNSKPTILDFALAEEAEDVTEVVVKASPFQKTEESPVSLQTIGTTEIQRNPGGNRDISKVVRVLPGVTTTAGFRNDLLIRGGAPNENRFYLDDVEVPNINHFATQGASGGPNGLINVDLIREVDFYSGAFPANRGNTLSSVFNFKQKNGRDDRLGFTATLGSSDLALSIEGPLSKKTTFIFSARQSYLQFLFKALDLPFLPTYNDFQFKVRTRLDNKNEFYFTGLGAIDRFQLNLDANETPEQRYLLNNIPVNNQWNYTVGGVYKYYMENSYLTFVLSRNMLNNDIFKYEDNDEEKDKTIDYNSREIENKLRVEHTWRFNGFKLNYGLAYEFAKYTNDSKLFQLINGEATQIEFSSKLNMHKYGLFGQLSKKLIDDRLVLSLGLRLDGTSYNKEMANPFKQVAPRFSAAFAITEALSFNFNTGLYYQLPAYTALGFRDRNDVLANKDRLQYLRSYHVVGGFAYQTKTATKFSIEAYWKNYDQYPFLLNEQISLANLGGDFGVIGNAPLDASSQGRSYGVELLVQQRLYKGFYGILAYTLGKVEFKDKNGEYRPSSWDSRHIINMALGKSLNIMNQNIFDKKNEKRLAKGRKAKKKMTPQTLELGINLRMQTGLPYTPFDEETSALVNNWNSFGQGIRNYDLLNSERTNFYYSVDFRADYKWYFKKWTFNLYLDLQGIPGIDNGTTNLILDQGESGNDPVQIVNQGQANESYLLKEIGTGASTVVPTLGVIVQF